MRHRQIRIGHAGVVNQDGHVIGLDIGATAVRAAVLTPGTLDGRPAVTVHGLGSVGLEPGVVANGVIAREDAVTAAIKRLWQESKFNCRNVILGIANPQVLARHLTIPDLEPQQRRKALPWQAREVVALPIDEVVLDFCPLGPPDPATQLVPGLLLATPREPVTIAVRAVERAGLRVARVDLASFAALRSTADEHLTVEAIIDLGAHLTTIVIHDRGVPKLVRTLPRGGAELTEHLVDRLGIPPHEAEAVKREVGLSEENAEVTRLLDEALRPLVAEIRTSIGYFRTTNNNTAVQRISLTGGGAALRNVGTLLSQQLRVDTRVVDPLQHVRNRLNTKVLRHENSHCAGSASAVSVGLAMGAAA